MSLRWKTSIVFAVVAALVGGLVLGMSLSQPAHAGGAGKGAVVAPRYSGVHTEGTELIVQDNKSDTLCFYTIYAEEKPGAVLQLRGSGELSQTGQAMTAPQLINRNIE